MKEVTKLIEDWAVERNLHTANSDKQVIKLGEEFGELCQGKVKGDYDQIIDSLGDMYVVMTILSMQLGLSLEQWIVNTKSDNIFKGCVSIGNGTYIA